MIVPAAMNIESAVDMLKRFPKERAWVLPDQLKELRSAVGEKSQDFQDGYQLGIQTARAIIASSVAVMLKGVNPDDVL